MEAFGKGERLREGVELGEVTLTELEFAIEFDEGDEEFEEFERVGVWGEDLRGAKADLDGEGDFSSSMANVSYGEMLGRGPERLISEGLENCG